MISVVLYGRNDNYGYNLHKRAALSFNCIAEVLTNPTDEIIFVDYNTPDDFPTFPEAIQDTLTKKAREMLRILRVRPSVHERFKRRTRLVAIEPVARNVGIRRSRPENRWILSTNTDMIFVSRKGGGISDLVRDLPQGFYHAPRIEIPETLWESFDRRDPNGIISKISEWGQTLHLNEIVLGADTILYDAPGDFQLIEREDLFANYGFDEDMLLGWHVDSNIAKRLFLKYRMVGDLGQELLGYHCDHTRQITPMHSHARTENDPRKYIELVTRPDLPEQAATWGCANDPIEEIALRDSTSRIYIKSLQETIGAPLQEPVVVGYTNANYDKTDYDPRHVIPFLADLFAASPRNSDVGWYGGCLDTLAMFANVRTKLGLTGVIYCDERLRDDLDLDGLDVKFAPAEVVLERASAFVFDFGVARDNEGVLRRRESCARMEKFLIRAFKDVTKYERDQLPRRSPGRRVIGINVINNRFENLVRGYVGTGLTPFSTRLRHGYVLPEPAWPEDWLPQLSVGAVGVRTPSGIANIDSALGVIAYGPYKHLSLGSYALTLDVKVSGGQGLPSHLPALAIEIVESGAVRERLYLFLKDLQDKCPTMTFSVLTTEEIGGIETRLVVLAPVSVEVQKVVIRVAEPNEESNATSIFEIDNWIPILIGVPGVVCENGMAKIPKTIYGHALYGPYLTIAAGRYQLSIVLDRDDDGSDNCYIGHVEVTVKNQILGLLNIRLNKLSRAPAQFYLNFEIPADLAAHGAVETRFWSAGELSFRIRSIAVKPHESAVMLPTPLSIENNDWLPYLAVHLEAQADVDGFRFEKGIVGHVIYGPYWPLPVGSYQLSIVLDRDDDDSDNCDIGQFEVAVQNRILGSLNIRLNKLSRAPAQFYLNFEIPADLVDHGTVETRFWSAGELSFRIRSITVIPHEFAVMLPTPLIIENNDWLPYLAVHPAARTDVNGFRFEKGTTGQVIYGPYWSLPVGSYQLSIVLDRDDDDDPRKSYLGKVEIIDGQRVLGMRNIYLNKLSRWSASQNRESVCISFDVSDDLTERRSIDVRLWSSGELGFRIRAVLVKPREVASIQPTSLANENAIWLPSLALGVCAHVDEKGIHVAKGQSGYVVYGPYCPLRAGKYEFKAEIEIGEGVLRQKLLGRAEIFASERYGILASSDILTSTDSNGLFNRFLGALGYIPLLRGLMPVTVRFEFEIPDHLANEAVIEARVWSEGALGFCLKSILIRPK